MAVIKGQFGGINTDRSPLLLPSGTATSAKNVELRDGILKKRGGFRKRATAGSAIHHMKIAGFENGQTFLVVQAESAIEYARIDTGSAISSLSTLPVMSGGSGGWWFQWADGLYRVSTSEVKKWQAGSFGSAQSGSNTTTVVLESDAKATDDYYNGSFVVTDTGTATVTDYVGSTQTATVSPALSGTPSTYSIYGIYDAGIGRADDGHSTRTGTKRDGTGSTTIPYYPPIWYDPSFTEGDKSGYYNLAISFRNSRTGEEGMVSNLSNFEGVAAGYLIYLGSSYTTYPSCGNVKFTTPNAPAKKAGVATYNFEYDQMVIYQSPGLNITRQNRTFSMYEVYVGPADNITTDINLRNNDSLLQTNKPLVNNGGVPPKSDIGTFNGSQAIYANIKTFEEDGLTEIQMPGIVMFSLPEYPCMVPRRDRYYWYANELAYDVTLSSSVDPLPWIGRTGIISDEKLVSMQSTVGQTYAFTKRNTWRYGVVGDGRIFASQVHPSIGSDGRYANCVANGRVHTISSTKWAAFGESLEIISDGVFEEILRDIPDGYRDNIVMGHYSFRNQVWAAIPNSSNKVKRILIWDDDAGHVTRGGNHVGALYEFEIESLGDNEEITALVERVDGYNEPTMLVGTSAGNIYEYPIGYADGATGGLVDYAAEWEGHFGQERQASANTIEVIDIHAGANVADNVTASVTPLRTDSETGATAFTQTLKKSNGLITMNVMAGPRKGRLFKMKLSSSKAASAGDSTSQWQINALNWVVN